MPYLERANGSPLTPRWSFEMTSTSSQQSASTSLWVTFIVLEGPTLQAAFYQLAQDSVFSVVHRRETRSIRITTRNPIDKIKHPQ